ncbi:hypothetical protein [Tateyamaria sp. ANG-S1]|uniref:hypothetical protein n=1 Tax=Tateyamaria sp. ANG-S1 TaxID=1577905 RepID=UPI00057E87E9|nr:hypothetical protein [Tateyamaria sp. ANG-S1]KIC47857.1 hypothetical protein RA29_18650 [Tateyamaria sp. ANG-S1]
MTLVLEHLDAGDRRIVQAGQPFTVGTYPNATWSLAAGGKDSGGELRVTAESGGASVVLVRGTAHLDQRALATGEARTVSDGAVIGLGSHRIAARFRNDLTDARASAAPTISTILADIAPGGITAESPVQARSDDDWISRLTGEPGTKRPDWDRLGRFDHRAEVTEEDGERDTPLDILHSGGTFLPDDWHTDKGDANASDTDARSGQSRPTGHVVAAQTIGDGLQQNRRIGPDGLAFLNGAGLSANELDDLNQDAMKALGVILRTALDGIVALERAALNRAADRASEAVGPAPRDAIHMILGAVQSGGGALADLEARLDALARTYAATHDGAYAFAAAARVALDPDSLRANATNTLRVGTAARAWALYEERFAGGRDDPPLSDRALSAAIRAHSAKTEDDATHDETPFPLPTPGGEPRK